MKPKILKKNLINNKQNRMSINFYKINKNQIDNINPKDIFNYLDSLHLVVKDKKNQDVL